MSDTVSGSLIGPDARRDAIHIALAPVIAVAELKPGERVTFASEGNYEQVIFCGASQKAIGIVDPFLTTPVQQGERFWLFLYLQTITGLRHQWTHPAFPPERSDEVDPAVKALQDAIDRLAESRRMPAAEYIEVSRAASQQWLTRFADSLGITLQDVLSACRGDEYTFGYDTPDECYSQREDMWHHFAVFTGESVPSTDHVPFHCAC